MKKSILFLIITFFLYSCAPKIKAPSILSSHFCGDLCWGNIVVGETTTQEFLLNVSTQSNVDPDSVISLEFSEGGLFDEEVRYQFYRNPDSDASLVQVAARIINQRVVVLIIQGELGLSFQEVVETFGEPNYISSLWSFDGGINVHFVNSSKGVEITSYFERKSSYVTPETEVNYLVLFDPDYFQEFVGVDMFSPDHDEFIIYNWSGYGKIEDHYWPPK